MATSFRQYWFESEKGLLMSANYGYSIQQNIITDKWKIVFYGTKEWNKQVKKVRYYQDKPQDKNVCLTVRSV